MAAGDVDQYFTYEARLASFQRVTKKRASSASRAPKPLNWPHRQISAASLARVGFFFRPTPESTDNTVCFLCQKGLDGWEVSDDPLLEHLKHSPNCGWAVCAAIEVEVGDYVRQDPGKQEMIDARAATFAGRWPHDGKKGWKCKTKQLVEAGWKYTPTEDSDDMATCTYCQLALDGWEPNDKPFDEHFNRSPNCPFFSLLEQFKSAGKGRARSTKARSSSQSVVSEISTLTDQTSGPEESGIELGAKKSRTKKAAATRTTRRKATKVEEAIDVTQDGQQADIEAFQPSQPKARRGRKRRSEAVESAVASTTDGPAPKKRTGQSPISTNGNSSVEEDDEMTDASASKVSDQEPNRHSPRPTPRKFPDDDAIERELEEDLAKQLSDADIAHDSDSERSQLRTKSSHSEKMAEDTSTCPDVQHPDGYPKFDPRAPSPGDKSLDDELKLLQAEMEVDDQGQDRALLPLTRTSLRRSSRPKDESPSVIYQSVQKEAPQSLGADLPTLHHGEQEAVRDREDRDEYDDDDDDGMTVGSTETVLKKVYRGPAGKGASNRRSSASIVSTVSEGDIEPPVKRSRGRPSKASLTSQVLAKAEETSTKEAPPKRGRGRPSKASLASQDRDATLVADISKEGEAPVKRARGRPPKRSVSSNGRQESDDLVAIEVAANSKIAAKLEEPPEKSEASSPVQTVPSLHSPSTPGHDISSAPSARQPVLSPSHSPQSSDAENQPPLNRPLASLADTGRAMLNQVATTPLHLSPSKRNVLAGLKSTTPWTAANIDAIFGTPHPGRNRENSVDQFLRRGRELTTPERNMTVEEWIYFNANEAEKKLKHECETLVSRFENEGTRAINVLEGLEVID